MNKASVTLLVIAQLLRAVIALNGGNSTSTMPVPADNVTVAGLQSDVQMIDQRDPNYIRPISPDGFVVPTTTTPEAPARLFPLAPQGVPLYTICPAYPNGGAPANAKC